MMSLMIPSFPQPLQNTSLPPPPPVPLLHKMTPSLMMPLTSPCLTYPRPVSEQQASTMTARQMETVWPPYPPHPPPYWTRHQSQYLTPGHPWTLTRSSAHPSHSREGRPSDCHPPSLRSSPRQPNPCPL